MDIAESFGFLFGSFVSSMLIFGTIFYFIKRRNIPFRQAVLNPVVIVASLFLSFHSYSQEINGQLSSHVYPKQVVADIVKGCKKGVKKSNVDDTVTEKICSCYIVELQKKYTYSEFKKISLESMNEGASRSEVKNVVKICYQGQL
jgi:hypothetical protein